MRFARDRLPGRGPAASRVARGAMVLLVTGAIPARANAQQPPAVAPAGTVLLLDGVTVVDVEQGKLVPNQRVVIAGNRIQAVGAVRAVAIPKGAQTVNAQGKYLIPGLWDLH